ncbi:GPI mannosyltransferase 4 [Smittium culicis]|uniref:GPI mannosyltransferase 4 n=1 Tax=Smittium culicis TaxID=133412 RepID=A0A1R1Y7Z3_9FUNG|nr:GPI mannosyltransferase 4 [Smittium culicis]
MSSGLGLLVLSFAPHQEMRFLLPMLSGFIFFLGISKSKISRSMMTSIALFNIILAFVFGYFHESGVVPAIWKLNTQNHQVIDAVKSSKATFSGLKNDTLTVSLDNLQGLNLDIAEITPEYKLNTVVWFVYTLIPPLHLVDTYGEKTRSNLIVKNTSGKKKQEIMSIFKHSTLVQTRSNVSVSPVQVDYRKVDDNVYERTLVVIPSIYNIREFIPQPDSGNGKDDFNSNSNLEFIPIFSIHNHIEFDSLDMYFKSLFKSRDLNCYLLTEKI